MNKITKSWSQTQNEIKIIYIIPELISNKDFKININKSIYDFTYIRSSGSEYIDSFKVATEVDDCYAFDINDNQLVIKLRKMKPVRLLFLEESDNCSEPWSGPDVEITNPLLGKNTVYNFKQNRDFNSVERIAKNIEKEERNLARILLDCVGNTPEKRMAMEKSLYESGGTSLNVNWDEVKNTDYSKKNIDA
ncbi:SGS domain protein [Hokovirus HKV1]|uniref:SGS domain protein n=1 Tax=Hokovirus HKV1 TaxID=1977638 RepID=A0A1V0SG74_9VIRU|nr:SGS domain protein [Hokovirus HKV1]